MGFFWAILLALTSSFSVSISVVSAYGADAPAVLNSGDTIEFDLLYEDDPPAQYTIGNQGTVSLPLIGTVSVAGLSVKDATERIRQTYIEQEIFLAPIIDLSVVSYRKITVLGDVQKPGLYEYESFMTAEQALGTAGGLVSAVVDPELRLLRRRELGGELTANSVELALKSAIYARLKSQIAGTLNVTIDLLPPDVQAAVDKSLFDDFASSEIELGQVELGNYQRQVELLNETITESLAQLNLIEQRSDFAKSAVVAAEEAAARAEDLRQRGLLSIDEHLAARSAVNAASATFVSVGESETGVRRELGAFRRELSELESTRKADMISQLQLENAEMKKLLAVRQSIQEQLDLIGQWIVGGPTSEDQSRIAYTVRRRNAGGQSLVVSLDDSDEILPGDILTVGVRPIDRGIKVGQ
jgi:polysaccharide export outer membrane protein